MTSDTNRNDNNPNQRTPDKDHQGPLLKENDTLHAKGNCTHARDAEDEEHEDTEERGEDKEEEEEERKDVEQHAQVVWNDRHS